MKLKIVPILITVLVLAMLALATRVPTPVAFAQACDPNDPTCVTPAPSGSVPASVGLIDVAFVLAAVSFFKVQFDLSGKYAIGAAFIVCLFVALGGVISDSLPKLAAWYMPLAGLVKLFLFATGAYDFLTDTGPKMFASMATKPAAPPTK